MEYRYRDASEMKDSGVEWIGKIPKDWKINKLKNISSIYGRIGFRGYTVNDLVSEGEGAITLSPSNIEEQKLKLDKLTYISWEKYEESPEIKVYNEDIVFVKTASVGKVAYIEGLLEKATINPQFVVFKNIKMNKKLLYYILVSNVIQEQINSGINGGVVSTLTQQDINNYYIPYQNNIEQDKIVNFLDKKTSQFDSIISKKEALIEKLEEAKKSLISEVVTGKAKVVKTDDEYDLVKRSSYEMKDSGVEWLGEIPKDWEVKRIKYLFKIKKNIAGKLGYDVLSVTQSGIKIKDITKNEGQLSMDYSKYQIVDVGDFVMNHMDLLTGFVDCSKYIGVTSPDYRVFRLLNDYDSKNFYNYIFQFCYYSKIFYSLGQGVSSMGRWRLQTETFKNFILPKPPIREQEELVKILECKIKEIEMLKNKLILNIQKLKEAKQSLISEAVTGKIEILD